MTDQVAVDQIAQSLLERYGETTDVYGIAQDQGLWLRPQLGGVSELRGRVIVFDVTAPEEQRQAEVLRCVALFIRRRRRQLERLAAVGETPPEPVCAGGSREAS